MFCFQGRNKCSGELTYERDVRMDGQTDNARPVILVKKCLDGKHLHDLTLPLLLMSHILNQLRKVLLKGEIGTSIYAVGP